MLLRRAFSIYRVQERGVYGGTVEIVFAVHGAGTAWLAELRPHDPVDVVGPLGKPFALPKERSAATLVGGGYGSAPLFALAERCAARGCRVDFVLGAGTEDRLFGALEAKRMAQSVAITTEDGSVGERGRVTDVLPGLLAAQRVRGGLRLRPDGRCCRRSPRSPARTARTASARSRRPWPAASASA